MQLTLKSACALRDGGIDATAALNEALKDALVSLPIEMHTEVKHAVGRAISAVLSETVELAVLAYPELEPNEETWSAVVRACAAKRSVAPNMRLKADGYAAA
jgi:hypothetical protein